MFLKGISKISSFYPYSIIARKAILLPNKKMLPQSVTSIRFMSVQQQFEEAKVKLNKLKDDPGNEAKLKIYGLYKQATEGAVKSKRPGFTDFVGRAKWDAWNSNSDLSQESAMQKYIELVNSLSAEEEAECAAKSSDQKYKNILVDVNEGLMKITLNRPKKMNALSVEMYNELVDALKEADSDPKTVIAAITGAGQYYCSGNDLSNFTNVTPDQIPALAKESRDFLRGIVGTFIDFSKPLVAVVNGPAVGISVTLMGLFDAVYSSDRATFVTPFSSLGQTPEGCSSYTFPRLMGYSKASELLFFDKKITAAEAHKLGIVSEVFPDDSFQAEIWPKLQQLSKLPVKSLVYSKELMRERDREILHQVNESECKRLEERWQSEDCMNAIMKFFSRKKGE